jgi:putative DNA primase/helicase
MLLSEMKRHDRGLVDALQGTIPDPVEPGPGPPLPDEPTPPESEAPEFSEDSLAARFTHRHADDLRYVAAWGRWLQWNGRRWVQDHTLHVFDRAREICRAASIECAPKPTIASRVSSAATVAAIERLVRADRRHAATVDQWDSDPWLLNTPGGIVDLRTARIEEHRRADYCTKITAASPGGDCPLWDAFLDRVTDGDRELQLFLKRMVGYCLTADTREHALFFLYGTGANGKSVFLNTVTGILNEYSKSAAIETFIASSAEHHPTDLAGLQGARLVSAMETEHGRRWAESKLKALTGGDKIAARFMRQDFFEFVPVFKLVIAGNHKPGLRSVDEAIRRRLHLVPFTVTIPPIERDQALSLKLRAEWGGILGWALEGCLEWQARGLNPPASVRDATEAYMASEDGFAQWLDAHCVQAPNAMGTAERLFGDWKTWAESAGEYVESQKRFSQTLEERGFKRARDTKGNRAFQGIGLRVPDGGGVS